MSQHKSKGRFYGDRTFVHWCFRRMTFEIMKAWVVHNEGFILRERWWRNSESLKSPVTSVARTYLESAIVSTRGIAWGVHTRNFVLKRAHTHHDAFRREQKNLRPRPPTKKKAL